MNIPSQTQLTKLWSSLSHELSDTTRWLRLLEYMKHPLMKCIPHDVERRVCLFALQSASLKLSSTHRCCPPEITFPWPSSGNGRCKPMSPTDFMKPTILRRRASEVKVGALMYDASSFMVYIKSGLSRPAYRHRPTTERYPLESFSESLWELSGNWILASHGTFCDRADPNILSNKETTLSTVVPGAKTRPSSTSIIFLLKKVMLDPGPFSSSWLTENLSFIFFRKTLFQKDFNPTKRISSTCIMIVASGVLAKHGCSGQNSKFMLSIKNDFKHKNHCFAPRRWPGRFLFMIKGCPCKTTRTGSSCSTCRKASRTSKLPITTS